MNNKEFFTSKRRWSYFKDMLLEKYLPIYFSKILTTNINTVYIDGFAGKGKFDDGADGSPIIVSNIIEHALSMTRSNAKISTYFIEYEFADELKKNLNKDIVISGDYKIEVPKIINSLRGENVFLYVDPFGHKHLKFDIFSMLKSDNINSSELLLNFNAFGFLRDGCSVLDINRKDIDKEYETDENKSECLNEIDNLNSIANGEYWIDILNDYKSGTITMREAENIFVNKYMCRLRNIFKFVLSVPIRTGEKKIPKYSMIFCSNYIDGFLLMANAMLSCDKMLALSNNNNQHSLFDYIEELNCNADVLSCVGNDFVHIKDFCVLVYQKIGVKYSHNEIEKALRELESEGKIIVSRIPEYTLTNRKAKALTIMNKEYEIKVKRN